MKRQYHILNGDSLKEQFPENIQGDIIVARECLVDGNVNGKDLDQLFASRARFISRNYGGTEQDYYEKTVPEFQKIKRIDNDSDINLWFEDDLFCQVNFWFVVHLIANKIHNNTIYLIRPKLHNQYGFGGLNHYDLTSLYENRFVLIELDKIASLWESYQNNDTEKLVSVARELEPTYPFILLAVEAHIERKSTHETMGRPSQSLITIMQELGTEEFGPVFKEFNKRESIYGFGDLQVKRLFDEIKKNRK
jgi:hypothetical protein